MSEIKTNQISASTGTELTLNARVRMIGDGASTPTLATHLCRKDYVDSHSRIGATVSFSMRYNATYDGSTTFGFTHSANTTAITFPTGTWTGWAVVSNVGGRDVNFQAFTGPGEQTYINWGADLQGLATNTTNAMFCLTRVS